MRDAGAKEKGREKTARIPIKIVPRTPLAKPAWIRVKAANPSGRFTEISACGSLRVLQRRAG
mgnify:CR=1 FL=1